MSATNFGAARDLLPRSSSPFYRTLVTCPGCSLSHFTENLEEMASLDEATKDEWKRRHPIGSTKEPDFVGKMRLLIEFEQLRGCPDDTRAEYNLRAAWIVRLTHNPFEQKYRNIKYETVHSYLEGLPSGSREGLPQARDLVKTLPQRAGEQRAEVLTIIGYLYCEAGEFDELLSQPELPHDGVAAVQSEEREFQRQAVKEMREALKTAKGEESLYLTYLIGELYRRLGHKAESQEWLRKALAHPSIDANLKIWAEEQLLECDRLPDQPSTEDTKESKDDPMGTWLPTLTIAIAFLVLGFRRRP